MVLSCSLLLISGFFVFNRFHNRSMHRRTKPPPPWPCNVVLKLNFPSIISQTNNGCNLLLLMLAKLLLLDISCENTFALSVVTALPACPFSINKCAKMSDFLRENRENSLVAGGYDAYPRWCPPCQILSAPLGL